MIVTRVSRDNESKSAYTELLWYCLSEIVPAPMLSPHFLRKDELLAAPHQYRGRLNGRTCMA